MRPFFQDLLTYTHHCNCQFLDIISKKPESYVGDCKKLFSHTLNAHHIWNYRMQNEMPRLSVWQLLNLENLQTINNENFNKSSKIIHQKNLTEKVSYTNSQGKQFSNTIAEILFHIVNHSSYHRGQLVSLLKAQGVEPTVSDYIFYKR